MVFCGQCGYQLAPGDKICPRCGTKTDVDIIEHDPGSYNPTEISHAILERSSTQAAPASRQQAGPAPWPGVGQAAGPLILGPAAPNPLEREELGWPLDVITSDFTPQGVTEALQQGPYGRCVYACDNDVVDHQVVNLLYENGATATFTMIGTSEMRERETILFGTRGELRGNGEKIVHYDFLTGKTTEFLTKDTESEQSGHGGGDYRLMQSFVAAVAQRNPALILSGPEESLETHMTVFAAEQARHENRIEKVEYF